MIADSKFAGFQAHKGNFSDEGAVLDNALIIGQSPHLAILLLVNIMMDLEHQLCLEQMDFQPRISEFIIMEVILLLLNHVQFVGASNFGFKEAKIPNCPIFKYLIQKQQTEFIGNCIEEKYFGIRMDHLPILQVELTLYLIKNIQMVYLVVKIILNHSGMILLFVQ